MNLRRANLPFDSSPEVKHVSLETSLQKIERDINLALRLGHVARNRDVSSYVASKLGTRSVGTLQA